MTSAPTGRRHGGMTTPVPGPPVPRAERRTSRPAPRRPRRALLQRLDGSPVSEHVEVFDGVHRLLQDALATLDEA